LPILEVRGRIAEASEDPAAFAGPAKAVERNGEQEEQLDELMDSPRGNPSNKEGASWTFWPFVRVVPVRALSRSDTTQSGVWQGGDMNAKAIFRVLIAAAGFLLSAACYDDPVALNESERPSPLEEAPLATAASSGGSSSVRTVVDPTRPRFSVGFSVNGALTPNSSISVTLQGTAVEKVAGGTVTVTLPTMAAMDHVGADKRPSYPIGRSYPVVSRWTLSAMEPGHTWQRSFSVTLPGKGYYHLTVDVDTNAPADEPFNPYVSDDVHFERWMLVTPTGGHLTRGFDDSVFADSVAPMPGPFRNKAGRGAAASQAAADGGVGMDSDDYVYMRAFYPNNGVPAPAIGGYAHVAEWHDHDHTDGPWNHESATVGSSGIVRFSCPRPGYHLEGAVDLPSTAHVAGAGFSGYWDASYSECGDTIDAQGRRTSYLPWKNLKEAIPAIRSHFGNPSVPRVAWEVDHDLQSSRYNPSNHRIRFASDTYDNKWTAAHEYGHAMHEKAYGGLWTAESSCYVAHEIWQVSGYLCAFQEGFADYVGTVGAWGSFESHRNNPDPRTEGYIAALFHDLIDSANENNDETTYSASSVATVFRTCQIRVAAGGSRWYDRNDVSDFVWCLENRINDDLHDDHFGGVPNPTHQRLTRSSSFDADDIRKTWLQNLTG